MNIPLPAQEKNESSILTTSPYNIRTYKYAVLLSQIFDIFINIIIGGTVKQTQNSRHLMVCESNLAICLVRGCVKLPIVNTLYKGVYKCIQFSHHACIYPLHS